MIKGILLVLFICLYIPVSAQMDTIQGAVQSPLEFVSFRIPDKEKIEEYKKDSRFEYKRIEKDPSLWDKIKAWFFNLFGNLFEAFARSGMPGMIVLIIIVTLICLAILKFFGVDYRKVLGRKTIDTPEIDIYTENVHAMDFDSLIANAMKNKDYRLVIRFLYLRNLKLLSDKEIIEWKANKTNYSYQHEIKDAAVRSKFLENTLIFDYVWYGEFTPDEGSFSGMYTRMDDFSKMLTNER
ncbi:hypothetical protein [Dysgonomonas sp. Marseille-P4677]|uniref:hypothetical protein n=1 Tax=Dysgonomonas sp. Marseille-P4677 TaxID=2364790 RepID=UPI001F312E4A|nr:hypothetical protein [Dysgonomonas sp. Marseille-P4677]